MHTDTNTEPVSKKMVWTGRIISGLLTLFLLADGLAKVMRVAPVMEATTQLGYPASSVLGMGIALVASTVLYAVPRTSILGAILLTGYLGGATATHVRVGEPFYFPIVFGVLIWLGLFLRDERLRALIPLRS